ncbi:MAG: putative porin [Muribaculaceae bacterium]|nr:putative porin [Muribaculaceae bacterium]
MFRRIQLLLTIFIIILSFLPSYGAEDTDIAPSLSDSVSTKHISSAWTLVSPLGLHKKADMDTLLYNYQRRVIPSMRSDAYATTGNLGSEGINMIYSQRHSSHEFFFEDPLSTWATYLSNQKFYNVYTPMTILAYNFAGNRQNKTDRLSGQFAGNVNRNIGIAAFIDYLYSKGCYESQATKDFSWGASVYYTGNRYEMQVMYNHLNFLNKENGGITNDLYITDPAEVQGGVDHIEAKSIPTNLTAAHNRLSGTQFFTTQAFKVGFWKDEQVNDTLTRRIYIPVTKFIYSLKYEDRHRFFINTNTNQAAEFWKNHYLSASGTNEDTRYWAVTNSFGIQMIEGFRKWAKFGLSAYISHQFRRFTLPTFYTPVPSGPPTDEDSKLTPLPVYISNPSRVNQNLLWIGGRLEKTQGSLLNYSADAKFGLIGDAAGELDLKGDISTNFKLFGDTVSIAADVRFANLTPSWFLRHYISNHFAWDNKFGKTRTLKANASLNIPWTHTTLSASLENTQNLIYFNPESLPTQHSGNVQVFSARLDQQLHFGIWNWNNSITYQATSNSDVLPLPALAIYSNMYLSFKAFNVLDLQIGVDCDFYTSYKGLVYQPATMSFHVQEKENAIKVGNYPFCNLYATARLYKVRFFVLWSHFNQGWFGGSNYFSMPHYPLNPRRLQFGLSVDFAD